MAALQIAGPSSAPGPIVTSGSDAKLATASASAPTVAVNHGSADVVAEVRRVTGGRGADVVVDCVGEATWANSLARAPSGRTPGGVRRDDGAGGRRFDLRRLFWHQWSILGSTMGSRREFAEIVAPGSGGQALAGGGQRGAPRRRRRGLCADAAGRADRKTRDRGVARERTLGATPDRSGADRQRGARPGGRGGDPADRLLPRPAGAALGGRHAQEGGLQSHGGRRRARRGGRAHRLPARSGAGAGQADLLAGDAGGDPARQHRARPREHQSDVRDDARLHPDADRGDRDHHPGDDRGRVRPRD